VQPQSVNPNTPLISQKRRYLPAFTLLHQHWLLLAILFAAVLVRVIPALYLGDQVEVLPGTADQVSYHALALRLIDGNGFTFGENWWPATKAGEPTAHWSFLYVYYLAAVYELFNSHPVIARVIQAIVVGILQVVLTFAITRRLFGGRAAVFGAALSAFYPYFIYYSATLMTEPFYITVVLGVIYTAIRFTQEKNHIQPDQKRVARNKILYGLGLGLLIGSAVLLRQLFLALVPVVYLWMWLAVQKNRNRVTFPVIGISFAVALMMILPFTKYNYDRFDRFVLLNTNSGYAFYLANHPFYGTNFIPAREMDNYQSLIPEDLLVLDEASLDQSLLKLGIQFVVDDPLRYLQLSISRIPIYFNFWPSADSGILSNVTRVTSFGLLLPFFLLGIASWLRAETGNRFNRVVQSPGVLLLIFGIIYSLIHVFTWSLVRYRLPVDALLIPFAALAVMQVLAFFKLDLHHRNFGWKGS